MSHVPEVDPSEVISEEEARAIRDLQHAYSARAKAAAGELADNLELDEQTRAQLLGQLGLKLADVDFEKRKTVADNLAEITAALGSTATAGNVVVGGVVEIFPGAEHSQPVGPVPTEGLGSLSPNETTGEPIALNRAQKGLLKRMYREGEMSRIEKLTQAEFETLSTNITSLYENLKIRRITAEGKAARVAQFTDLMHGKSIRQIAEESGLNDITLRAGLYKMADGIAARLTPKELAALIPDKGVVISSEQAVPLPEPEAEPESPDEEPKEQPEDEPEELGKEQIKWFERLFDDEAVVAEITNMSPNQRAHLTERLSHWAYPAIVRKIGPERARVRVEIMKSFLGNQTKEGIAADSGVTDEVVKQALYHVGRRLKETTTQDHLLDLVAEAKGTTH